ncbi:activator-dependent family glycosyltransferase [Dactylosporangium sp. NBC_01737]|uniref:activator-dependent family glycosyltransferase n=1 Tax=Dactylosporangium sp. NBC_01737 TaxID=2975959 RepID=UPI002E0E5AD7|nr:activator-dependent family glycosyltransferase [Dactylosporangium sp. NBC_01737]
MRVLFVINPEKTIFQYMAATAWALRTAGHEVRVASQPAFAGVITQAGLTAVPVGSDRNPWRITAHRPEVRAEMRVGILSPYDAFDHPEKATWDYLSTGLAEALNSWHKPQNFPIVNDLVDFARAWRPDLVIWEPMTFAGPIAAKACGAAHARLLFGIDVFGGVRQTYRALNAAATQPRDPIMDWFAGYGRRFGFEASEDMFTGHFTLDQFPLTLQDEAPGLRYLRMRYVPYGGAAVVPKWLREPPARPRVALTMGLSATEIYNGYTISMREVLDAFADLDIHLVATVADAEREALGAIPANTTVVPYVPWQALAPTCSAVVQHGGAATIATTALHPVPQLSVHYHFDQPILARKLTAHGAGLDIPTAGATGAGIRDAVVRLLTEPSFAARAADLRAEILALPSPNEVVPEIEQLTVKHRSAV